MARLEELERKFEENPRRYFAPLANEYRKAGDAQRAAELCRAQLPEVPGHISGHIVLGQALYDARDFDGSRASLETALALDPENIVALRYLGDIARDTGDAAEAERWYSRTLEADPYNEAATTALQALRAAPVGGSLPGETQMTEETPQSADEYPQPQPDSLAAGFEPTSHVEPEPPEPIAQDAATVPEQSPTEEPTAGQVEISDEAITPMESIEEAPAAATDPGEEALAVSPEFAEDSVTAASESAAHPSAEGEASPPEVLAVTGEFAGDLSISTAPESAEPAVNEASTAPETAHAAMDEPSAAAETVEPAMDELAVAPETTERPPEMPPVAEPAAEEPADVAAHAPDQPATLEEVMQAEERVLESAAPFVTETMADLYLEQGYPHEALELLLQLSEQRPQDEELRAKIEHIESVIVARRDAAVAAARAERAESAEAAEAADVAAEMERLEDAVGPAEPEPEGPISVHELFARMDRARPRAASSVTPRPISRRRSDFVSMPEGEAKATELSDDPFAFPSPPESKPVPRTSGPHQTFNPSTADADEFNAWLRGLRGP